MAESLDQARLRKEVAGVAASLVQSERLDGSDLTTDLRGEFGDDAVIDALRRVEDRLWRISGVDSF